MEMEKSKVLIQFLLIFRQSGYVLFFLYARRLRGYTATVFLTTNCRALDKVSLKTNKSKAFYKVSYMFQFFYLSLCLNICPSSA